MERSEQQLPNLGQLLKPETTREQFESIAGSLLSEKDKQIFGEAGLSRVLGGILYLAPFAPEPATFDEAAYRAVACLDDEGKPLKDEEAARLLQIAKETGVIKDAEKGRLMVNRKIHPILENLLNQY
jgi:hypothetical protein